MGQISDTLESLDTETLVEYIENERHLIVIDPSDIFKDVDEAVKTDSTIRVEIVGDGTAHTVMIIEGKGETLLRLTGFLTMLRQRRIDL